ncbi:MAG: hypothetical protein K6G85_09175 [Eubacterium sp.]|nr:hypothetical protein [Eubacterium sp.]
MKTGILAIYDVDISYGNHLMNYISEKEGMPFKTVVFTEKEALYNYLEEQHIDLLLISGEAMDEKFETYDIGKIILLSPGDIFSEYIGYSSIYKYQSSENIIREVLDYYVDVYQESGSIPMNIGKAKVLGVYSPVGRIGKTTFALTMGQILASDERVLYLNLEEFAAFEMLLGKDYSADLSDLLYYYRQYPESLHIKIQIVAQRYNNLSYIPPVVFSEDLRQMKAQEWISFIETINSCGLYDRIILDISSMLENPLEILKYCDEIYMPVPKTGMSLMKVQAFETFLERNHQNELMDKIIKIPMAEVFTGEEGSRYLEEQLWGELGDRIREKQWEKESVCSNLN